MFRGLADMNGDGKMDVNEFSVACKLINLKLKGMELPKSLPPQVGQIAAIEMLLDYLESLPSQVLLDPCCLSIAILMNGMYCIVFFVDHCNLGLDRLIIEVRIEYCRF